MSNKLWIKLSFFLTCFVVSIVIVFNYSIDSMGLLRDGIYEDVSKNLSEGKIIAGLENIDNRLLRKKQIWHLKNNVDYIAIGSSRIMELRKKMFYDDKNISFYNYGVPNATLEDYMALLQIHKDKFKKYPKNVIFGIDPWVFNEKHGKNGYMSVVDEYLKFLNRLDMANNNTAYTKSFLYAFSFEYFLKNIKNFMTLRYYIADSTDTDDFLRMPDGSIYYPYNKRFPNLKKVQMKATGDFYMINNFYSLHNKNLFEKFMLHLISSGVRIYFYLPPYHPITYKGIMSNKKYSIVGDVEQYLRDFAKENNIKVVGSYNPDNCNLNDTHFFDGIHMVDRAYGIIFKEMLD